MKESRLVHAALFLLLVAFSLVYALFFDARADEVRDDISSVLQRWGVALSGETIRVQSTGDVLGSGTTGTPWVTGTSGQTNEATGDLVVGSTTVGQEDSFLDEVLGSASGTLLPNTDIYYGSISLLQTLNIRYEYVLKDKQRDIFYVYIGKNPTYNLTQLIEGVGGKPIEIYAKNDIVNNLYFGDRVTFAEMPQQLATQTNVFIRTEGNLRLIQDNTGEYKQHKRYIRQVFTGR